MFSRRYNRLQKENRKLREVLKKADEMLPWLRQGTIWVGGRADETRRKLMGIENLLPTRASQKDVDTFENWVREANKRAYEYKKAREEIK